MTDNGKQEIYYIVEVLEKTPKELMTKVLWSAMHILKVNPNMSIREAMDYAYNDWVKEKEGEEK